MCVCVGGGWGRTALKCLAPPSPPHPPQGYGLGVNSMTGGQKSALIFGGLLFCVFLFLGGYFLD